MRAWWRARSRNAKARLIFYPSLVAVVVGLVLAMTVMPGKSHRGPLPAATPEQTLLRERLRADVAALGGERNTGRPEALERAASVVEAAFREAGHVPKRLAYDADGVTVANVEVEIRSASPTRRAVVVGAHYDSAPGATGADDNASGVAALLALARAIRPEDVAGSDLRLVAFVNEEPPHFWNASMGSLVYAKACKARGDDIVAMVSLETLGYFDDAPGSQKYPPIVSWLYPDRGDFIGFVGNLGSRSLVRSTIRAFRESAAFPSEGAALPSFVQGVGWSDHWSFWQIDVPAVMVTDTAPFRNPNYHTPRDTPDTLDYDRLARVTAGLVHVVRALVR